MIQTHCNLPFYAIVLALFVSTLLMRAEATAITSWVNKVSFWLKKPVTIAEPLLMQPALQAAIQELHHCSRKGSPEVVKLRFAVQGGRKTEKFLGVSTEKIQQIAKEAIEEDRYSVGDAFDLMDSPYNEQRFLAILLLTHRFESVDQIVHSPTAFSSTEVGAVKQFRETLVEEYARRIPNQVNNVNLVDLGALPILGGHAFTSKHGRDLLYVLAKSENVWKRRSAIRATEMLAKHNSFEAVEIISKMLLRDSEPLVVAAIVRALRQAGEYDASFLADYLKRHVYAMPRNMFNAVILPPGDPKGQGPSASTAKNGAKLPPLASKT